MPSATRSTSSGSCHRVAKAMSVWPRPRSTRRPQCGAAIGPGGGGIVGVPPHRIEHNFDIKRDSDAGVAGNRRLWIKSQLWITTAGSLTDVDYAAAFLQENRAFSDLIRDADESLPVPTCPGWNIQKLLRHVGRGDRWAAQIVSERRRRLPRSSQRRRRQTATGSRRHDLLAARRCATADRRRRAVRRRKPRSGLSSGRARRTGGSGAGCMRWRCTGPTPPSRSAATSRSNPTSRRTGSPNGWSASPFRPEAAGRHCRSRTATPCTCTPPTRGWVKPGEWTVGVGDDGITWSHEHGKGSRGAARRRHRAAAGDGATSAGRRYRHRGVRRRRRLAKVAGPNAALAKAHGNLQTMTTSEIATVLAWHDALNASDLDTLVALSSDDIDIGDAHGAAQGHEALRRWAAARESTAELGRMYRARRRRSRRTEDQQSRRSRSRHDRRVGISGSSRPRHLGVPA